MRSAPEIAIPIRPAPAPASRAEAEAYCRSLARRHYENFPVLSLFLPAALRPHFAAVYAFCRIADDFADELHDPAESLRRLDEWQALLDACYEGRAAHPVFVALQRTIGTFDLPKEPFLDLLAAFRQDRMQSGYRSWQELLGYCAKSANPVGRLVLRIAGCADERRQSLSDCTCTALQLANFWQDVARDYRRGRIYIPREILDGHGCTEDMLGRALVSPAWRAMMADLLARTRTLFAQGLELVGLLGGRMRLVVALFSSGGLEILRKIEQAQYDTLTRRPQLAHLDKGKALARALRIAAAAGRLAERT